MDDVSTSAWDQLFKDTIGYNIEDADVDPILIMPNDKAEVEDLYSHQYGLETIKTISNRWRSKTNIIPLINGTGTVFPVMMLVSIRDSLREYKSNYVILSSMKISLYN